MSGKIWCLIGVHEYESIDEGPFKKYYGGVAFANGRYFILRCKCCGTVKRKVMC